MQVTRRDKIIKILPCLESGGSKLEPPMIHNATFSLTCHFQGKLLGLPGNLAFYLSDGNLLLNKSIFQISAQTVCSVTVLLLRSLYSAQTVQIERLNLLDSTGGRVIVRLF